MHPRSSSSPAASQAQRGSFQHPKITQKIFTETKDPKDVQRSECAVEARVDHDVQAEEADSKKKAFKLHLFHSKTDLSVEDGSPFRSRARPDV